MVYLYLTIKMMHGPINITLMNFGYTDRLQYRATDELRLLKVNTVPRSFTSCLILDMYFGVLSVKTLKQSRFKKVSEESVSKS